jgi:pimeloyl-ACP methyl ester carboxylesterase
VPSSNGHERFALAGHDRGARVGYRLALDHPGVVTRFASPAVVPTLDAIGPALIALRQDSVSIDEQRASQIRRRPG